ncbi:hypothetical protein [Paenisporosarcina sp. TG-14]|uniref:hypothetical protein n=1 Tax=Paenisporosarcina sp. TG-14 TaxID=1231057 RepID=UPI00030CAEB1|nr:hypothetical protein [Paenisporosarcina sp. TG-14]
MFENNYTFVVKEYNAIHILNGELIEERVIGIGIKNLLSNNIYPSPLTNYIRSKYKRKTKSLSSQRNAAYELIKFLNYSRKQIENENEDFISLSERGLFSLKLKHGSSYITSLSLKARAGDLTADYVYRVESYLINFYQWLSENSILSESVVFNEGSPFNRLDLETFYPGRDDKISDKLVDFGENRYELVRKFIAVAQDVAPEIALGICFQFFGGLRAGEVVNLTKAAIESPYYWNNNDLGEEKFILQIRNRTKILFSGKQNLQHEQVKVARNQSLLINPDLSKVYKEHKALLVRMDNRSLLKNNDALFVSKRTGEPISGKSYKEKFHKIKDEFLRQLSEEGRTQEFLFLTNKRWSTHIGRGVFTNFLLQVNANVTEVAIARGDKNINSVMAYVEETNAINITKDAINNIRTAYIDKLATIESSTLENFRSRG